jgi:large subunit ribosomal protein L21
MKFAVIETGGKQYRVQEGERLRVEKLAQKAGDSFEFDKVLLRASDGNVEIGKPFVHGARIRAKVVGEGREDKKIVYRFHSKTRYRKKKGHRQAFTEVEITSIS